jgi:hypothetical protein
MLIRIMGWLIQTSQSFLFIASSVLHNISTYEYRYMSACSLAEGRRGGGVGRRGRGWVEFA